MIGVRFREDTGFEGRCDDCRIYGRPAGSYWPLTVEYWNPRNLTRCRACEAERRRAQGRLRYLANRDTARARSRTYYAKSRAALAVKRRVREADPERRAAKAAYLREWRRRNRGPIALYQRAYRADAPEVKREMERERNRKWMAEKREAQRRVEGRERYERRPKVAERQDAAA